MEIVEKIETLNQRLIDHFGLDTNTGRPIFRIVWANDQFEKRMVDTLDSGIHLLFPEVREVKKYPYMKDLYVLERLVVVPDVNRNELLKKLSYEPLWAYCNQNREYVPPIWSATKFVVDTVYAALGKKSLVKYKDDEMNITEEGRQQRIANMHQELFGNETDVGDALAHKQAIVVPHTPNKDSAKGFEEILNSAKE